MLQKITSRSSALLLLFLILAAVEGDETSTKPDDELDQNDEPEQNVDPESDVFSEQFVANKYFVDKSDLLSVLYGNGSRQYFITCPSGFGKTTNLHMIRKFSQLGLRKDGSVKSWKKSKAWGIFCKLNVFKNRNFSETHFAQYVTIFLNFDFGFDPINDRTCKKAFSELSRQLMQHFRYYELAVRRHYGSTEAQHSSSNFTNWLQGSLNGTVNATFEETFNYVFEALSSSFDCDMVLLIDNYDYNVNPKFKNIRNMDQAYQTIHQSLSATIRKYRQRLHVVIVGVTSMGFYRHKLDELVDHRNFLDDTIFGPYFGLLETEMRVLFKSYKTPESEQIYVNKYYDSYKTALHRYNTLQITNYFVNRQKKTSSVTIRQVPLYDPSDYVKWFFKHPDFLEDASKLLKHVSVADTFNKTHNPGNQKLFDELVRKDFNTIGNYDIRFLYTLCFEHGYLGRAKDDSFVIPNYHTRRVFETDLRHYYEIQARINVTQLGLSFVDIFHRTANRTGDISSQLRTVLEEVYNRLRLLLGPIAPDKSLDFTYHSIIHLAGLTQEPLTVVDDYPQPILHHRTESNIARRCVTLIRGSGVAVIFKITVLKSVKIALEQAMSYAYSHPDVSHLKYVGINVDSYGLLSIDHCPKNYLLRKGEKASQSEEKYEFQNFNFDSQGVNLNVNEESPNENEPKNT